MKIILNFFKSTKFKIGVVLFVISGIIGMAVYGYLLILPNSDESVYGGRLEGLENFDVSDSRFKTICDQIEEKEFVISAKASLQGKIINIIVYVDGETELLASKALTSILLEEFNDEEKAFFDLQIFLTTEEESELYPKIGYKSSMSVNFVWTN